VQPPSLAEVQDDSNGNNVDYEESDYEESYVDKASISSDMNIGDNNIVTPLSLYEEHKTSFYRMY
jgi:hypothetical protein